MTGELALSGGKVQYIDFSFIMAENGRMEKFLINADGKDSEKANIEYRIMNIECRSKVFCLFYKKD
jgi:hypothetical protein